MKIGVVHNIPVTVGDFNWESSQDVLEQVEAVEQALRELDLISVRLPFGRDVETFLHNLRREKVDALFNLCETVDDNASFVGHPAALFELINIPFTGSGAFSLMLSTDKLAAKHQLRAAGFQTPDFVTYGGEQTIADIALPAIIKPRYEDASIGIDQESLVFTEQELWEKVPEFYQRYGQLIIERYINGREFNISLLGYPEPRVLPVAEIDFSSFPEGLHRIVGYRAKWDKEAFEYHHTERVFPDDLPESLGHKLQAVAAGAYQLFAMRDYGRIDMRCDEKGQIYVLEGNANPCLNPDAGFAAAARRAGMSFGDVVAEFVGFLSARAGSPSDMVADLAGF